MIFLGLRSTSSSTSAGRFSSLRKGKKGKTGTFRDRFASSSSRIRLLISSEITNGSGGSCSSPETDASSSDAESPDVDGDEWIGSSVYVDAVDRDNIDPWIRTLVLPPCCDIVCTGDTGFGSSSSIVSEAPKATRVRRPASRRPERGLTSGAAVSLCNAYAVGFGVTGFPAGAGSGGAGGVRIGVDPLTTRLTLAETGVPFPTSDPTSLRVFTDTTVPPFPKTLVVLALTIPTLLGANPPGDPPTSDAAVRATGLVLVGGVGGSTTFRVRARRAGCAGEGMCIFPVTCAWG